LFQPIESKDCFATCDIRFKSSSCCRSHKLGSACVSLGTQDYQRNSNPDDNDSVDLYHNQEFHLHKILYQLRQLHLLLDSLYQHLLFYDFLARSGEYRDLQINILFDQFPRDCRAPLRRIRIQRNGFRRGSHVRTTPKRSYFAPKGSYSSWSNARQEIPTGSLLS
jgi:hypothetical protein